MSTDNKALASGFGSVQGVVSYLFGDGSCGCSHNSLLENFLNHSRIAATSDDYAHALDCLCCAWLNRKYRQTGRMFKIDGNNEPSFAFHTASEGREMIADLAGL